MDYSSRWKIIKELGGGGQGKVSLVLDTSQINEETEIFNPINKLIQSANKMGITEEQKKALLKSFQNAVTKIVQMNDLSIHGALKVLHEPEDARDADLAETRIKKEIQAMSEITHPNLLKILDCDPDSKWFVSQYHPKGTLYENLNKFAGDFPKALRAFRPLVEGVSELHKKSLVHRDIKPQNVFLDSEDNLVLGDFGLVFFNDGRHTRISATLENVGSRDWMPAWAMGVRIEDIKPSFDVFSLGKLLWSMVSGRPFLRLWYFDNPEFNLENLFPNIESMKIANRLLKKCIVEREKDCLLNATLLLNEVDKILFFINNGADMFDPKIKRQCKICGIGHYILAPDLIKENLIKTGSGWLNLFICSHCGNVQLFSSFDGTVPIAWEE